MSSLDCLIEKILKIRQQSYESEKMYIWHLLKTVQLPRESFELFPLYPVGSLVLQGDLDKGDMRET